MWYVNAITITIKHMNKEWIKCPFARQVNAVYERNGTFALKFHRVNLSMYHPRWPVTEVRAAAIILCCFLSISKKTKVSKVKHLSDHFYLIAFDVGRTLPNTQARPGGGGGSGIPIYPILFPCDTNIP